MITGCLQQKNGYYYAVLYTKVDGKRKCKWIATKLPVNGTSNRKAQKTIEEGGRVGRADEEHPSGCTAALHRLYREMAEQHSILSGHDYLSELFKYDQGQNPTVFQTVGSATDGGNTAEHRRLLSDHFE